MNQAQFANVLIKAMPYYTPYSTESGWSRFMCNAIKHYSNCSEWKKKRAVSKIRKLIAPEPTLELYLQNNKFIGEDVVAIDTEYKKKTLTFWAIQIALGKECYPLGIDLMSYYLKYNNEYGWGYAEHVLNKYVKNQEA